MIGARLILAWLGYRWLDGKSVDDGNAGFVVSPRGYLLDAGVYDSDPCYSPDGKRLVFALAARRRPYSMGGWTWD